MALHHASMAHSFIRHTTPYPRLRPHTWRSDISPFLSRPLFPSILNFPRVAEKNSLSARAESQSQPNTTSSQPAGPHVPNLEGNVIAFLQTQHNTIRIVDLAEGTDVNFREAGGRLLFLDDTGSIHSVLYKDDAPPGSYWDECAAVVPLLPPGPIGVLGLAGGTVVRSVLKLWPEREVEGWEIDEVLIDFARMYLRLGELEEATGEGGRLRVHIGDAFGAGVRVEGGFAGLFVDLFSNHSVPPQLAQRETLESLVSKLRPGGSLVINCGGYDGKEDDTCVVAEILSIIHPNVSIMEMDFDNSSNVLVMVGPTADVEKWRNLLPPHLQKSPSRWVTYVPEMKNMLS